jgi:phospholipase/lecithinase/hemolysin
MNKSSWGIISFFLLSFLAIVLCCISTTSYASRYSNLIVFGDSLSDIGNNTWVVEPGRGAKFKTGAPISNIDPKTKTPQIWVQYLVKMHIFNQTAIIPSRAWQGENLTQANVDYAWASAETGDKYLDDLSSPFSYPAQCRHAGYIHKKLSCVPGVMLQVKQYLHDLHRNHQKPGQRSMFVLWAGGNDIFDNIERALYRLKHSRFKPAFILPKKQLAFSWFPSKNIYNAVNLLINAGVPAQHIYVFNLPNIAATPGAQHLVKNALKNSLSKQQVALYTIGAISSLYNSNLKFWLTYGIRSSQKPHVVSIEAIFHRMVTANHFLGYHFLDTQHSCLRLLATPYCTGFLFFNDKHPSTTTGKLLAVYVAQNI